MVFDGAFYNHYTDIRDFEGRIFSSSAREFRGSKKKHGAVGLEVYFQSGRVTNFTTPKRSQRRNLLGPWGLFRLIDWGSTFRRL